MLKFELLKALRAFQLLQRGRGGPDVPYFDPSLASQRQGDLH